MVDLRREHRPTERAQAKSKSVLCLSCLLLRSTVNEIHDKQARKEQALVKAKVREAKKQGQATRTAVGMRRDEQENIGMPHDSVFKLKCDCFV
jgi:hypothetical protein